MTISCSSFDSLYLMPSFSFLLRIPKCCIKLLSLGKDFEQKLILLDKKVEEIYKQIRAEGEIEKKRIIEEAMKLAEKIKEQTRFTAEQEIKKAREEIKGEIAHVAVEMAEEILRHEMTAADHERLIKEYLEKVRMH